MNRIKEWLLHRKLIRDLKKSDPIIKEAMIIRDLSVNDVIVFQVVSPMTNKALKQLHKGITNYLNCKIVFINTEMKLIELQSDPETEDTKEWEVNK